jgi:mannosyltransferase OCH1-like enzyme
MGLVKTDRLGTIGLNAGATPNRFFLRCGVDKKHMIPAIHHMLWTTPNEFARKFHAFRISWMQQNPSWDFRLHRLTDLPFNKFPPICSSMLTDPAVHWVLKSDIARWLIVWLYGGVYADTDVECLKPMDRFLSDKAFCANSITPGIAGNAVFGAEPGYQLFIDIACAHAEKISGNIEDANKTIVDYGVNLAGKMLLQCNKIYPAGYFYPVSWGQRREGRALPASEYTDAYCMHHWSGMDDDGWYSETIGAGKNRLSTRQQTAPAVFYGKNTPQGSKGIPESKRPAPSNRLVIKDEPKPTPGGAIIPKIIHRIWFGPGPLDAESLEFIEAQKSMFPDYEHMLWTWSKTETIYKFGLPSSWEMLCDDRLNVVIKSDILRYEILRLYGGIYLDTDVEILKPFTPYLDHPFFCGREAGGNIGSAVLGSIPFHPIAQRMLVEIAKNYQTKGVPQTSYEQLIFGGPELLTSVVKELLTPSVKIFESDVFYPARKQETPATIHHFAGCKTKAGWTHRLAEPNTNEG